jgi:hypothetical protein
MRVVSGTQATPGRANEDFIAVADSFVVMLDGVTEVPGIDTGCRHGVVWLVRTLGSVLAEDIAARPATRLDHILALAIRRLRAAHGPTCDLTNPWTPSSTVAIVRERDDAVDYLVLCDSTVVLDGADGTRAVTDDRTARLPAYDRASVARLRNAPQGFWVASTLPEAARHALTGSVRRGPLRRVLVCTDGVSRLVERFGHTWAEVVEMVDRHGPGRAIEAVRSAERAGPPPRRGKIHDDATVALCHVGKSGPERASAAGGASVTG